ncbi:MAG: hypothetical protein GY696_10855 [Gammaproteobacteria bacterium]|nr:hypothetical protein [Gammaproteobacteria bacterium]
MATPSVSVVYSTGLMPTSDASFWVQVFDAISAGGGVQLLIRDRNFNTQVITAAVVKKLSTAPVKSLDPEIAAKLFEMNPHQFDAINQPVDVLFGHNHLSIFPKTEKVVGEAVLVRSIFVWQQQLGGSV